jgi:hypothetical protein
MPPCHGGDRGFESPRGRHPTIQCITMLCSCAVRNLVMQRQCLDKKADQVAYDELFRLMGPVQPPYWCRPGSPPGLVFRAKFDEYAHVFDMRSRRIIVKGRFQGGTVAYIFADELPLFASIYSKDKHSLTFYETEILELLRREGPMNIALLKEFTGLLSKEITPVLHRLQQKFLVFEDQVDNEWDRAWYPFESEFPDLDMGKFQKIQALKIIIMRFAYLNVFINVEMTKSFYKIPMAEIKEAIIELESEKKMVKVTIGQEHGYVIDEDIPLLEDKAQPLNSVYVLHRNDFLVKSNEYWLKKEYKHDKYNVLQYILIGGAFRGTVVGFFKNGPFIVEDIVLDMEEAEADSRKQEILEAVMLVNDPALSPIKRYCGEDL